MQQVPRPKIVLTFIIAMFGIALILILSIALVIVVNRYLDIPISIEQSLHYVFMLIGSLCLPWITHRFLHAPSADTHTGATPIAIFTSDQPTRWIKTSFYLLTLLLFWGVFGPWTYLFSTIQYLMHMLHRTGLLLLILCMFTLLSTSILAALLHICSRFIAKIHQQQQTWYHWRISLSFSFGLLCFTQLLLNMMMLKFLF